MKRGKGYDISERLFSEACMHLKILNSANQASISGQENAEKLCIDAIQAFRFFDFELVNKVGLQGATSLVRNLPSIPPRKNIIDYYSCEDNFQGILLTSSKVSCQNIEFNGDFRNLKDIGEDVEIKFKFSEGLESFDLTFNLNNTKEQPRPLIPLVIESKYCLTEKTKNFSWFENQQINKFVFVTDLGRKEQKPVTLKNVLDVSKFDLSAKMKILISGFEVKISIPRTFCIQPINNKQTTRKFFNVGFKAAA